MAINTGWACHGTLVFYEYITAETIHGNQKHPEKFRRSEKSGNIQDNRKHPEIRTIGNILYNLINYAWSHRRTAIHGAH